MSDEFCWNFGTTIFSPHCKQACTHNDKCSKHHVEGDRLVEEERGDSNAENKLEICEWLHFDCGEQTVSLDQKIVADSAADAQSRHGWPISWCDRCPVERSNHSCDDGSDHPCVKHACRRAVRMSHCAGCHIIKCVHDA